MRTLSRRELLAKTAMAAAGAAVAVFPVGAPGEAAAPDAGARHRGRVVAAPGGPLILGEGLLGGVRVVSVGGRRLRPHELERV